MCTSINGRGCTEYYTENARPVLLNGPASHANRGGGTADIVKDHSLVQCTNTHGVLVERGSQPGSAGFARLVPTTPYYLGR